MINWNSKFLDALWAYRSAYKFTTKFTSFQLVYGQEAILPIELELPSLRIAIDERFNDEESLQEIIVMLERLNEVKKSSLFKYDNHLKNGWDLIKSKLLMTMDHLSQ